MHVSSAPGAAFLLGEHAVVYGEPAVLCAVDLRARAKAELIDSEHDVLSTDGLCLKGFTATHQSGDIELTGSPGGSLDYIVGAVEKAREYMDSEQSLKVTISSDIPVGGGLGSSAAVVVAAIHAGINELGGDVEREQIASLAHDVELEVQGSASPSDTYTSAVGGITYVEPDEEMRRVDGDVDIAVGYDGGDSPTGEMVDMVGERKESNEEIREVIRVIGDVARRGRGYVENEDIEALGEAMNINQGLLEAIGVGGSSLSEMVWAARKAGASGAKLTGAGGEGCVVAVPGSEGVRSALESVGESGFISGVAEGVRSD